MERDKMAENGLYIATDPSVVSMLGKKLYKKPLPFIVVKECLQNAVDAGAHSVNIQVKKVGDNLSVIVEDDGSGIIDFQKHFSTIGGSYKVGDKTVGGYGIAKLAVMACDAWEVVSINGKINKYALDNHLPVDFSEVYYGTKVVCSVQDSWYGSVIPDVKKMLEYCYLPEISIKYNGEEIASPETTEVILEGGYRLFQVKDNNDAKIVVTLNGLYQFAENYYVGDVDNPTFIFDIWIENCNPYSPEYPLNATREGFAGENHPVSLAFFEAKLAITKILRDKAQVEKQEKSALRVENGVILAGGMEYKRAAHYGKLLNMFKKYADDLLVKMNLNPEDFAYGFGDGDYKACYFPDHHTFVINPTMLKYNKATVQAVAIHEVAHVLSGGDGHYENFALEMTRLVEVALS